MTGPPFTPPARPYHLSQSARASHGGLPVHFPSLPVASPSSNIPSAPLPPHQTTQRDGCPKIINVGASKTDRHYEQKKYGFKTK